MMRMETNNRSETQAFASLLAEHMSAGQTITLEGDLGAGKTTFVQGFAKGLQISERVKSPTFNILKIYNSGKVPLFHMDAYRLEDSGNEEGFEEYMESDGITIIEWPQFIAEDLPLEKIAISLTFLDENRRAITIQPIGKRYEEIVKKALEQWSEQ